MTHRKQLPPPTQNEIAGKMACKEVFTCCLKFSISLGFQALKSLKLLLTRTPEVAFTLIPRELKQGCSKGSWQGTGCCFLFPCLFLADSMIPQIKKGVISSMKPPFSMGTEILKHFIKPPFQ